MLSLFSSIRRMNAFIRSALALADSRGHSPIPAEYASMAPYLLTILALVFASKRVDQPAALSKPFERGD